MTVLVDTSVWSLALRRRKASRRSAKERIALDWLNVLIEEGRAALSGPIRQEILSGVRSLEQFDRLRQTLSNFPHIVIQEIDYDRAAECFNLCRGEGVAATTVDMLICAIALRVRIPLLTTDRDFTRYARVLELELVEGSP